MTSIDILNIAASISILVLIGFICYLLFYLVNTIKTINLFFKDIADILTDIKQLERKIKNIFWRGGENMKKKNSDKKMMSDKSQKGQSKKPSSVLVGSVGAVAGAALGAAAATALSNRHTREKLGEALSNLRDRAVETIGDLSESTKTMREQGMRRIAGMKGGRSRKRRR